METKMDRNLEADCHELADAFFENLQFDGSCEYGSIGTDCKRPFGNSFVEGDILEIIGWAKEGNDGDGPCFAPWQIDYARDLYCIHLIPFLQKEWEKLTGKWKEIVR
jgi:hypothetical protein